LPPDVTRFVVTARTTSGGAAPFDVYTVNIDGSKPKQLTQNYDALDLAGWR
jgi:Tol biopolymer transport system component